MSDSRTRILNSLRQARQDPSETDAIGRRLSERPRAPRMALLERTPEALIALFAEKAEAAGATVSRETAANVPKAVARYLASENLPAQLLLAPDPEIAALPWAQQTALERTHGTPALDEPAALTGGFAGIAETGTLMLLSGPEHPTAFNFLPDTHIVALPATRIVPDMEAGWASLRAAAPEVWPRTVNLVTGPSRSADIGQQLQMGAHGPRRLHIVLVEDAPST